MGKKKRKDINELTKDFDKFIEGKELNPNHKEDFERVAKGVKGKKKKLKVRRAS